MRICTPEALRDQLLYLFTTVSSALRMAQLEVLLPGWYNRLIRKAIRELIELGHPIASGPQGYWLDDSGEAETACERRLRHRGVAELVRARRLLLARTTRNGRQMTLPQMRRVTQIEGAILALGGTVEGDDE